MCLQGLDNMFFYDGTSGRLEHLDDTPDDGDSDWIQDSIAVFDGDYTNPENKPEM